MPSKTRQLNPNISLPQNVHNLASRYLMFLLDMDAIPFDPAQLQVIPTLTNSSLQVDSTNAPRESEDERTPPTCISLTPCTKYTAVFMHRLFLPRPELALAAYHKFKKNHRTNLRRPIKQEMNSLINFIG